MTAWVVRGGRDGGQEGWNLEHGQATVGFKEIGDLTGCPTREDVRSLVQAAFPGETSTMRIAMLTGQLWAFRSSIASGDLVVMPLKTRQGYIALGRCTGGYFFDAAAGDPDRRHGIHVDWQPEAIPKTALKDDLLFTLNALMTVFRPTRNDAAERLEHVFTHGVDPGSALLNSTRTALPEPSRPGPEENAHPDQEDVTDPDPAPSVESIRDRIRTHLVENFAGHKLSYLVADILEALGFTCEVSPAGPDGGVDILAGSGPLGLDSPTLIVEVKSEPTPVGSQVVRGLHSAINQHRAEQGLLVAWGGVSAPARREFSTQRTQLRIWDSEDVLDHLFKTYDNLPAATRLALPLKQVWVLDDQSA